MLPTELPPLPEPGSPEAFTAAASHLAYEFGMIAETANWLEANRITTMVQNSVLEAFLIHVRNAVYFFWQDKPNYKRDVLAVDFFDNPATWINQRPPKPPLLTECAAHANVHVAHLSYDRRLKPEHRQWMYGRIYLAIREPIVAFINLAPPDRLHPDLRRYRAQ